MPAGKDDFPLSLAVADSDRGPRVAAVDIARGAAILLMVVYHLAFDLSAFRLIATDVQSHLGWMIFARSIAGSFLFLVGVSLVLATERGIDWGPFLRRLGLIAGGAALVSLGTWWYDPGTFVFFGILHEIALASVLSLPFLRLPTLAVAVAAVSVLALPFVFSSPVFDWPPLWWVGLGTEPPVSVDYVPVFPWFAVVLAGIVGGRSVAAHRERLARWRPDAVWARWLSVAGRWSLLIYLVHQPLLIGAISIAAPLVPANEATARANFMGQCTAACGEDREAAACQMFCGCMFGRLWGTELFAMTSFEQMSTTQREAFDGHFGACWMESEAPSAPAD